MVTRLVLASASPRRKALLAQLGLAFDMLPVDIDETPFANEPARDYVSRMARQKAEHAWPLLSTLDKGKAGSTEPTVVLASDTSVVLGDSILGKPADQIDFERMMASLSGRQHEVLTSVCLLAGNPESQLGQCSTSSFCVTTKVSFKPLEDVEIKAYWASGEPVDKAGGYGIQGKGAVFVDSIEGSYSNVVGLPLKETCEQLARFHINIW